MLISMTEDFFLLVTYFSFCFDITLLIDIRLDSSSSDHGFGVKAYQTKFNFKAFSSDLDPEVSGSKPYK